MIAAQEAEAEDKDISYYNCPSLTVEELPARLDEGEIPSQLEKIIPDVWTGTALPDQRCYLRIYWCCSSTYHVFLDQLRQELPPRTQLFGYQGIFWNWKTGTRCVGYRVLLWPPEGERLFPGEEDFEEEESSMTDLDEGVVGVICEFGVWCSRSTEEVENAVRWIKKSAAKDIEEGCTVAWFIDGVRRKAF
jgi:hypothetical protein